MLLKFVHRASGEGPGVQTMYGNDVPGTRRTQESSPALELRSTRETPSKERKRRNALPFILLPDAARVCGTVAPWGPSGGVRRESDYVIPENVVLSKNPMD
jgi:hypothetical protein